MIIKDFPDFSEIYPVSPACQFHQICVFVFFLLERRKGAVGGAGFKIFRRTLKREYLQNFLRMYVELSAALKIFENFLFANEKNKQKKETLVPLFNCMFSDICSLNVIPQK